MPNSQTNPSQGPNTQHGPSQGPGGQHGPNQGGSRGSNWQSGPSYKPNSNFNAEGPLAPFAKTCEVMWTVQEKCFNALGEITTLNQEFCHNFISELQNCVPGAGKSGSPSSSSPSPENWKQCMTSVVQYSEKCAQIWQECCNDISGCVKDHCEEMSQCAPKWGCK